MLPLPSCANAGRSVTCYSMSLRMIFQNSESFSEIINLNMYYFTTLFGHHFCIQDITEPKSCTYRNSELFLILVLFFLNAIFNSYSFSWWDLSEYAEFVHLDEDIESVQCVCRM